MKVEADNELDPLATVALLDRELPRARLVSGDLSGLQSLQGGKRMDGFDGEDWSQKDCKSLPELYGHNLKRQAFFLQIAKFFLR